MRSTDIAEYLGNEHHRMECKNERKIIIYLQWSQEREKKHKENDT